MSTTKSSRVLRAAAAGAVCLALAFGTAGVALAGSAPHNTAANTVDRLLEDLDEQMQWGIANDRRNPVR